MFTIGGDTIDGYEDDQRTISSESCIEGLPEVETRQKGGQGSAIDCDIWQRLDIDSEAIKELPNADKVLQMLNNGNWEGF